MTNAASHPGRPYLVAGTVWLALATIAGVTGLTATLQPPVPQAILGMLTMLVLLAFATRQNFRRWVSELDLRWFPAFHLTRFVGISFLLLHRQGALPYAFAVPGGWGDILVAASALLLLILPGGPARRHGLLLGWNLFGLLDILFVVATASRLAFAEPASMAALMRFPLSLLPTFLVPLIIASHVMLFWRLMRWPATNRPT